MRVPPASLGHWMCRYEQRLDCHCTVLAHLQRGGVGGPAQSRVRASVCHPCTREDETEVQDQPGLQNKKTKTCHGWTHDWD